MLQVGPNAFQLLEGFRFQRPPGSSPRILTVPAHDLTGLPIGANQTDLASVPWFLWWFVSSYGQHTKAALLHDHLLTDPAFDRIEADLVFREALTDSGVSWVRRWVMWAGVTIGTMWDQRRLQAVLLFVHLVLVLGLAGMWLVDIDPGFLPIGRVPGWWVLVVASTGVVWGMLWPWSVAAAVLLGPPTVLVGMAVAVVYAVELLGSVVSSIRGDGFEMPKSVPYRHDRDQT